MILSVCIPVYNQDVTDLVSSLLNQTRQTNGLVNIVLIDDHSNTTFQEKNKAVSDEVKYITLEKNIGRSKIRNKFLEYSDSNYFLFIDCDSTIISDHYIASYLDIIENKTPSVVVGSSVYQSERPALKHRLRWRYGSQRESQTYRARVANPNTSFKTNNFVISRDCFLNQSFNEELKGYGHEDTLFGYELNKKNIEIQHLDNPVLNGELDTNDEFLIKTEEGLINLLKVWELTNQDSFLTEKIKILNYLEKYKNSIWFNTLYGVFKTPIRFCLRKGWANLHLFDFYKLGYLIRLKSKK